jgi:hypothetical protein
MGISRLQKQHVEAARVILALELKQNKQKKKKFLLPLNEKKKQNLPTCQQTL